MMSKNVRYFFFHTCAHPLKYATSLCLAMLHCLRIVYSLMCESPARIKINKNKKSTIGI